MVNLRGKIYGLDLYDDTLRVATLIAAPGTISIDSLSEIPFNQLRREFFDSGAELYFSVPDDEAVVRRLRLPDDLTLDPEKLALFEFAACLPEDSLNYYLETYRINGERRHLAVAYHRSLVQRRIEQWENLIARPSGFRLRSLALAEGYRRFCRRDGGEVICLINIDSSQTFLVFVNHDAVVSTVALNLQLPDEADSIALKSALIDIAASVRYQNALIFNDGFTAPLSLAVLSGQRANLSLSQELASILRTNVVLPTILNNLLPENQTVSGCQFLVSLGLTTVSA